MLSLLLLLLLLLVVVVDRGGRGCRQMAKESHHVRYTNTRTLLAEKTTELANWQKEWRQQTIRMVSPLQTCRSHRDSICRCRPTKKLTRSQSPTELHTHTHTHLAVIGADGNQSGSLAAASFRTPFRHSAPFRPSYRLRLLMKNHFHPKKNHFS